MGMYDSISPLSNDVSIKERKRRKRLSHNHSSFKLVLEEYTSKAYKVFSFAEIEKTIRSRHAFKVIDFKSKLKELLLTDPWIFVDEKNELCIPRRLFFGQARFLILPTVQEIQQGILFPGHRFYPFCSHLHFPPDSNICLPDGTQVKRRKVCVLMDDVLIYHSLFSMNHVVQYFVVDHKKNIQTLSLEDPEQQLLTLTVFNLNPFYKAHDFHLGDGLILTVLDWNKGSFSLEYLPKEKRDAQSKVSILWFKRLEESFERVFEQFGINLEISEQIAYAFYYAGADLLKNPCISLSQIINTSRKVELTSAGLERILWYKGEKPEESLSFMLTSHLKGDMDSLNDILLDIGVAVTQNEIEAYMRDEHFSRRNSLESALNRCFAHREHLSFYNEEQREEFFRYLSELWEKISRTYNYFQDQLTGKYRSRALNIYSYCTQWIRTIDEKGIDINFMPKEEMLSLFQVMGKLSELFETLNRHVVRKEEEDKLAGTLEEIELTIGVIKDKFEQKLKPDLKLVRE
jgi:hypothetical protein